MSKLALHNRPVTGSMRRDTPGTGMYIACSCPSPILLRTSHSSIVARVALYREVDFHSINCSFDMFKC